MTILEELSHKPNRPAHNPAAYQQAAHKPAAQWCVVGLCEDWLGGDNVMRDNAWQSEHRNIWQVITSQGRGNYQQPQLPTSNKADADLGTEKYSLFRQILSTHSGVWGLYATE